MSKNKHKRKQKTESILEIEKDERFGFIAGYTSNGVPYGLTHEEMKKLIDDETDLENLDND